MCCLSKAAVVSRDPVLACIVLTSALTLGASGEPQAERTAIRPDGQPLAWQRTDQYVAPDFEGFFPDDSEGGKKLDQLFRSGALDSQADEEILKTVHAGLRRTSQHRTLVLRWLGNKYIWNKSPQNSQAIEIMYHAADFRKAAEVYGVRHYAVYFGLSVVQPKTRAILQTLAELCMRVDDRS